MAASLTSHLSKSGAVLTPLPKWERLSPLVVRVLGLNPGPFTLTGTNTYLVGRGKQRILVDAAEGGEAYMRNLAEAMQSTGCESLSEIVITHWHSDHVGGVADVQRMLGSSFGVAADAPVRKLMPEADEPLYGGEGALGPYASWPRERFEPIVDGETIACEGATLTALHTPGHANDHVCLWLEEEAAMFSADNVLGTGTAVFRDLNAYLSSLRRMLDTVQTLGSREQSSRLYPGHGPVVPDGAARIDEYLTHREARVRAVGAAVEAGGGAPMSLVEVARRVYPDLPESHLPAAASNAFHALRHLAAIGAVGCVGPNGASLGRPPSGEDLAEAMGGRVRFAAVQGRGSGPREEKKGRSGL
jgi:glyoxylase-like metal-dependent hydrolase (beta-lactamase superfamily II)